MAKRKRTKLQRKNQLHEILEMHYQRIPHKEIAAHFNVSESQIKKDLTAIHRLLLPENASERFKAQKRILGKFELLEKHLWEAWVKSTKDKEVQSKKKIVSEGAERMEVSVKTESQSGSAALAGELRRCLLDQAKLLGANNPDKVTW